MRKDCTFLKDVMIHYFPYLCFLSTERNFFFLDELFVGLVLFVCYFYCGKLTDAFNWAKNICNL